MYHSFYELMCISCYLDHSSIKCLTSTEEKIQTAIDLGTLPQVDAGTIMPPRGTRYVRHNLLSLQICL